MKHIFGSSNVAKNILFVNTSLQKVSNLLENTSSLKYQFIYNDFLLNNVNYEDLFLIIFYVESVLYPVVIQWTNMVSIEY